MLKLVEGVELEDGISNFDKLVELQKDLEELHDEPAVTKDGKEIRLLANVDVTGEIDLVVTSGAEGIGLYRSEQILDETGEFPSEDELEVIYSKLSLCFPNRFDGYNPLSRAASLRNDSSCVKAEPVHATEVACVFDFHAFIHNDVEAAGGSNFGALVTDHPKL